MPLARRTLTCLLALMTAAPLTARAQAVSALDLTPRAVTLAVGERREMLASAYSARGDIVSVPFRWVSSDPNIVRVEPDPGVPGVAYLIGANPGTAVVEVQAGGRAATASVTVTGGAAGAPVGTGTPTVLHIEPTTVYLLPTEDILLRPVFLKDDGSPAAPVPVVWISLREEVARIGVGGRAIGISPGQGVIEARTPDGRLARRVPVRVENTEWAFGRAALSLSPGVTDTVRVIVPGQEGRALSPRSLTWGIANPGVATVSAIGLVTGVAPGRTQIVASGFGQELRATIVVHRQVESLTLSPPGDTVDLPLGGSRIFGATARAADDTAVPEAALLWEMADTTVAGFNPSSGTAIGRTVGATTLTVTGPGPGLEKSWRIRVTAAGFSLDARRLALRAGERRALRASYTDAGGRPIAAAPDLKWTSSDPSVLMVRDGVVEAVAPGSATVLASAPFGRADTARVYVNGELLVSSSRGGTLDVYTFDRRDPSRLSRLTSDSGQELGAVYSPDGLSIAYVSDRDGNFELYVADADGRNPRRLTTTSGAEGSPAWTPDGRRIVYDLANGRSHVWIVNADGSDPRQLTRDGANLHPAVSSDGRTIAFASRRDRDYEIYLMEIDGSNQRNFSQAPGDETLPAWIGDSTLVFLREARARRSVTRRVTTMSFARAVGTLTPQELLVSDFAVSARGDLVAATVTEQGDDGDIVRLFLVPVPGGAPAEVPRQSPAERLVTPSFRP